MQLIKEKLTNLDESPPPLNYNKILNPPFLFPLLELQKKFSLINMSRLKSCSPLYKEGRNYENKDVMAKFNSCQTRLSHVPESSPEFTK